MRITLRGLAVESDWRDEALRTNLWLIPAIESLAAVALFAVTLSIDEAVSHGALRLPSWVISGSPDAARQILSSLAGAIITVVGVVFSIVIVTLTLASQQFGPRMLRTFIRDRGAQVTLGTFVATFFYAMLVLISIGSTLRAAPVGDGGARADRHRPWRAHLLHPPHGHRHPAARGHRQHRARPGRGHRRRSGHRAARRSPGRPGSTPNGTAPVNGPSAEILLARLDRSGRVVAAPASGYLRFVRHATLVRIAAEHDAVIRLHHRPGHFLTKGHPMATVWPPEAATAIGRRLETVHLTGPLRTLSQDIAFGIDQLVEIAIRALSPAVNDTFTALTCIDWLGDSLCKIAVEWHPQSCHLDRLGTIRLITVPVSYERLVQRSFEKVRQAADGMPAVLIRQLDALAKVMAVAPPGRSQVLLDQAAMIARVSERTVPEPADQADVTARYQALLAHRAQASHPR